MGITLYEGDCRVEMAANLAANSIDAIVTDPPYEAGFIGQKQDEVSVESGWADTGVAFDPALWRECLRVAKPGAFLLAFSATRLVHKLATAIDRSGWEIRDMLVWAYASGMNHGAPVSPDGQKATLKPAWEPIVMARKPFEGSLQALVKRTGVGGLHIEETRIPRLASELGGTGVLKEPKGREPSNFLLTDPLFGDYDKIFMVPKPGAKEREGNTHPTVKPEALMRHLVRLVTPKRGTVLDPFCGSGTTMVAAKIEGFEGIAIDMQPDYLDIAEKRLQALS
jgi:site-specific DNA-methyltransferase (adenine-specific)